MSITASEDGLSSSEAEDSAEQPPAAAATHLESEAELTAMLLRVAKSIGLEVKSPPSPERSKLNDWYLGSRRQSQPCSAPVPFFMEVH